MSPIGILYLIGVAIVGTLIVRRLFELPHWLTISIGPALGIVLTSSVTLVVALVVGFTVPTLILALLLVLLLMAAVEIFVAQHPIPDVKSINKLELPFFVVLVLLGGISLYIFGTKVLTSENGNLVTGGGGLYADTALHSGYTMSIVAQGLPPTNPLYAGISLAYPFMVNFVSASLFLLGFSLRFAFIVPQLLYLLGFVSLFYYFSRSITTKLATLCAILIFFFGWGLGFLTYFKDVQRTQTWQVKREYTNNLDNFHMHNVLTGLIFPERSFLPGLFIGMLLTTLFLNLQKKSPNNGTMKSREVLRSGISLRKTGSGSARQYSNITIGLLLGILSLWHTHTFLFFSLAVAVWIIVPLFQIRRPNHFSHISIYEKIKQLGLIYGSALILVIPVLWWFSQQLSHKNFLHFTSGWMNSGSEFLRFWFYNSGLFIPLSLVGIWLFKPKQRVVFFPALMMFMIANLVTFQPWDWDNIKLLSWVFLFASLAAGHTLARLFSSSLPIRLIGLIFLISLVASGILSVIYQASTTYTIYDQSGIELAEWIKANTQAADVFLIDPAPTHPVPGLTGRSVYLGYPGHLWVHGISYQKREQTVREILAGNLELLKQTEVPINYLVVEKSNRTRFQNKAELELVYTNSRFAVFQIN